MATSAFSYEPEEWTHDWEYSVVGYFGDPDSGGTFGADTRILAGTPGQAERRVLTYIAANFDDPMDGRVTAEALGGNSDGTYLVRVTWPGGER